MNNILAGLKAQIEEAAKIKIYRNALPHGTDMMRDVSKHFRNAELKAIFDIGANVGQTVLDYSQRFPKAAIYSFEPVSAIFTLLQKNTSHLKNIRSFKLAFGRESGEFQMIIRDDSRLNALVLNKPLESANHQTETVKVTTLDQFASGQGVQRIDLLKIDTEGHDLDVLKGATEMLSRGNIDFIQVETGFGDSPTHVRLNEFIEWLHNYGYAVFGIYDQQPYWTGEPWLMYANAIFVRKAMANLRKS